MKYLKSIRDLINEKIEAYPVRLVSGNDNFLVKYEFEDSSGNRYLVEFKNDSKNKKTLSKSYEMAYYAWDNDLEDWNVNKMVSGNPYSTLKTIFENILKDFLKNRDWIKSIWFEGLAKEQEKDFITQRTKLYLRHLKNNPIDGFSIENWSNNKITLVRKNK